MPNYDYLSDEEKKQTLEKFLKELPEDYKSNLDIIKEKKRIQKHLLERQQRLNRQKLQNKVSSNKRSDKKIISISQKETNSTRLEDIIKKTKPSIRIAVDSYSINAGLKAANNFDLFKSKLSYFFPSLKENLTTQLRDLLVYGEDDFKKVLPENYSLLQTFDAIKYSTEFLKGQHRIHKYYKNTKELNLVSESIKKDVENKMPFFKNIIDDLILYSNKISSRLVSLKTKSYNHKLSIYDPALVESVRSTCNLIEKTREINIEFFEKNIIDLKKINFYNELNPEMRKIVDINAQRLVESYKNIKTFFKPELFPLLLKYIDLKPEEFSQNQDKYYDFLNLSKNDFFSYEDYNKHRKELQEKQKKIAQNQQEQKSISFSEKYSGILKVLNDVFPGSDFKELEQMPDLINYFDRHVYNNSLKFYDIQNISRHDPIGQIMVIHRIVNDFLNVSNPKSLDNLFDEQNLVSDKVSDLYREWSKSYDIFNEYTREVNDFSKEAFLGLENEKKFKKSLIGQRSNEILNQIRNSIIKDFGHTVIKDSNKYEGQKLYKVAEELNDTLAQITSQVNRELIKNKDEQAMKTLKILAQEKFLDLTFNYPSINFVRDYLYKKTQKNIKKNPVEYQLFSLEIFASIVDMYSYLLNDENSFYKNTESDFIIAREEEKVFRERRKDPSISLRKTLDSEIDAAFNDELTGLKNKNFYQKKIVSDFNNFRKHQTLSYILLDIDNFKKVNDSLGHNFGDKVLSYTGSSILETIRKDDLPIRYGGEEFLIILPNNYEVGVNLAKRIAQNHKKSVIYRLSDELSKIPDLLAQKQALEEFRKLAEFDYDDQVQIKRIQMTTNYQNDYNRFLNQYKNLTYATLSMGVREIGNNDAEIEFSMTDKLLYAAKESGRNRIIYFSNKNQKMQGLSID